MRKRLVGKDLRGGVSGSEKPDHEYFLALLKQGKPVKEAKIAAGFSPNTKTKAILAAKKTMLATRTPEDAATVIEARNIMYSSTREARDALATTPGHTFVDNANKLVEIRDDMQCPGNVAISAIKEHNSMMGNHAPIKSQVESMALVVELGVLSKEELEYLSENGFST